MPRPSFYSPFRVGRYVLNRRASSRQSDLKHGFARLQVEGLEARTVPSTLTVNNLGDYVPGSLRAALEQANSDPDADTIRFAPGLTGTIALNNELPALATDVAIEGPGAGVLTVHRLMSDNTFRLFTVQAGAEVGISGLTLSGGVFGSGAGIANAGNLVVSRVTLEGNFGDAVFNEGTLEILDSTIRNNQGGRVSNFGSGVATIRGTTITGNAGYACALANYSGATLSVVNSTVSGNREDDGNVIINYGTATLLHVTLHDDGVTSYGPLSIAHSVFQAAAGTLSGNGSLIVSDGYNLYSDDPDIVQAPTDLTHTDPMLASLADNGGPTWTHALLPGSPALNAIPGTVVATDQRGVVRPQGTGSDIGAYEKVAELPPPPDQGLLVTTAEDETTGNGRVSLREAILYANSHAGADTIQFAAVLSGQTITLTTALSDLEGSVTLEGLGAEALSIARSQATGTPEFSVLQIPLGATVSISGLTITGGRTVFGGGITSRGTLHLTDVNLRDNRASDEGGAILTSGTAVLTNVSLVDNQAGYGGGISNIVGGGGLSLRNVTFTGNVAVQGGGGLWNNALATATLVNVTFSSNAALEGGGIANNGIADLTHVTLADNRSDFGGGILNRGTLEITNTIVAGGIGRTLFNSGGQVLSGGGNLFSDTPAVPYGTLTPSDRINTDPLLGPLGNYGGSTTTLPLRPYSPAIGQAQFLGDVLTDQRGVVRPQGRLADSGAFELEIPEPASLVVTTLDDVIDGFDYRTSLREALFYAHGGVLAPEIRFADDLTGTIRLDSVLGTLAVTTDLTLRGPGSNLLTVARSQSVGTPEFSLFTIGIGINVVLTGLTLTGGQSSSQGGGIWNAGVLRLTDINFHANQAAHGGAINNVSGAELIVENSVFTNNIGEFSGGAIYDNGSSLTIRGSLFANNQALGQFFGGGAISSNSNSSLLVTGSRFENNSSYHAGGLAIFQGSAQITDCTLSGNWGWGSSSHSGAVYLGNGTLVLTNSTLSGNYAGRGGGIALFGDSSASLVNSTLSDNRATLWGGGVVNNDNGNLTLTHVTLARNQAPQGAGLYNRTGTVTLVNSLVDQTGVGGPSVYNTGTFVSEGYNIFSDNPAVPLDPTDRTNTNPLLDPVLRDNGGPTWTHALLVPGSPALHAAASLPEVTTDQRGVARPQGPGPDIGAFELGPEGPGLTVTTLNDVMDAFDYQTSLREAIACANSQAGADTIRFATGLSGTILVSTPLPVLAGQLGIEGPGADVVRIERGGFFPGPPSFRLFQVVAGANVNLSGLTIAGGDADYGGGIRNEGTLTLSRVLLRNNRAIWGGGIFNVGELTLDECILRDNTADYGGGLYNEGRGEILNAHFTENTGNSAGGALANDGMLRLDGCTLDDNRAVTYAGGAIVNHGILTVFNTNVSDNDAGQFGGGIDNGATLTVVDSTIDGNTAGFYGGGLASSGNLTIFGSTIFANTTAQVGGGVYNSSSGHATITDTTLSGNVAEDGGGLYTAGMLVLDTVQMEGNTASQVGGALANIGSLSATAVTFRGNSASFGGGMYNFLTSAGGGTMSLERSTLVDNRASSNGGGIYNLGDATVTNVTFSANAARSGGGIDNHRALLVRHATFRANTAQVGGGVMNQQELTLVNSVFDRNDRYSLFSATPVTSLGHNIFSDHPVAALHGSDVVNTDPLLDPVLKDNGGPTLTHALLPYSPALGSARPLADVTADQRGVARPQGYFPDSGAFELDVPEPVGLVVTTSDDVADAYDYKTSLREAITLANSRMGQDVITFATGVTGPINLAFALPALTDDVTINGPGADVMTLRRLGFFPGPPAFSIFALVGPITVSISGLGIEGGKADYGGGIYNPSGQLRLTGVVLAHNEAAIAGGGVYNATGSVTITDSTLSANRAATGGGVYSEGSLNLERSTLATNQATVGAGMLVSGTTLVLNSTFSGNNGLSDRDGGGVDPTAGGAIANAGHLEVGFSTFRGNVAATGGSVYNFAAPGLPVGELLVGYSIFDSGEEDSVANVGGVATSAGYNLFSDDPTVSGLTLRPTDLTDTDAQLGPLADNGGPTKTHLPGPASLAIQRVQASLSVTTDQRGVARPQGALLDIGAVEVEGVEAPSLIVTITADRLDRFDGETSLREALLYANANKGRDTIRFRTGLTGTMNLSVALPDVTDPLVLSGPGADVITVTRTLGKDVPEFRFFTAQPGIDLTVSRLTLTRGRMPGGVGGAVAAQDAALVLDDVTLHHNVAQIGGAVFVSGVGSLTLRNARLTGNTANLGGAVAASGACEIVNAVFQDNTATGYGGAVFQDSGTLVVTRTTLDGNGAEVAGGGLFLFQTTLTLVDSTLRFNLAQQAGGALATVGGSATIRDSVFHNNAAGFFGGGVYAEQGTLTITNATFSQNLAEQYGGGLLNYLGEVELTHVTLNGDGSGNGGNVATIGVPGFIVLPPPPGGSTLRDRSSLGIPGQLTITNSLFSSGPGGTLDNTLGTVVTAGYNLFSDDPRATGTPLLDLGHNGINTNPLLGDLADNGGPTWTHALLPRSPARNRGVALAGVASDQRGIPRPQESAPDVGAFEYVLPLRVEAMRIDNGDVQRSNVQLLSLRFNQGTNLQQLIDTGAIVNAVQIFGTSQIVLGVSRYRYDAATFTLTLDLTADGFGGSETTVLANGRYQLCLDTSLIAAASLPSNTLVDDDGTSDGTWRHDFHRLLGDFNGDAQVSLADRDLFFAHLNTRRGQPGYAYAFDLSGDGIINIADYLLWTRLIGTRV